MSSPVNPWTGWSAYPGSIPGPNARQFLRQLWVLTSEYEGGIETNDTIEVYGVTFTCTVVGTGLYGQVVFTDTSGAAWYVPNYACPLSNSAETGSEDITPYNAAENTGS
jgi:hypothetical protein